MKFKKNLILRVFVAMWTLPLAASAAIYMEYEGVDGFAMAKGYANHHVIDSLSWAVSRGISANREASRPSLSEIAFSRQHDFASAFFFREAVSGSAGKKVTIRFVQDGADQLQEYMRIELEDVLITSMSQSASSTEVPKEVISLSYTKIIITTIGSDSKGGGDSSFGYDLSTAQPL